MILGELGQDTPMWGEPGEAGAIYAPEAPDVVGSAGAIYEQWTKMPPATPAQKAQVTADVTSAARRVVSSNAAYTAQPAALPQWQMALLLGGVITAALWLASKQRGGI